MAINATNESKPRELIPAGNYVARCYQMIHIGTVTEIINGDTKTLNKVRIGWELPTETRVFKEENGQQPFVMSKEFTLSMNEKSNLRKVIESWRGKALTEEQARSFDITVLLGKECMLNIIHKVSTKSGKTYEEISGVTPMPKGFVCPPQVNPTVKWEYDNPDWNFYETLPGFLKEKIQTSVEYKQLANKVAAAHAAPLQPAAAPAPAPSQRPIEPLNPGGTELDTFLKQDEELPF